MTHGSIGRKAWERHQLEMSSSKGLIRRGAAMLAGRRSSKETTTLHWQMSDDAWVHWAQGLGETSVRDVILERIDQIRKNSEVLEVVRGRCEAFAQEVPGEHGQPPKHEIKIQLPAVDWAVACQRVGRFRPSRILAALIRESAS